MVHWWLQRSCLTALTQAIGISPFCTSGKAVSAYAQNNWTISKPTLLFLSHFYRITAIQRAPLKALRSGMGCHSIRTYDLPELSRMLREIFARHQFGPKSKSDSDPQVNPAFQSARGRVGELGEFEGQRSGIHYLCTPIKNKTTQWRWGHYVDVDESHYVQKAKVKFAWVCLGRQDVLGNKDYQFTQVMEQGPMT